MFRNTAPIIEFGQSPAQGVAGPFVYAGDTTTMADTAVALVLASPQVESDTLQTLVSVVHPTQVSSYNTNNGTNFSVLPDSLFTISDTVNILPGYRVGSIKITLKFPGLHNYALPLKISASYFLNNNQPVIVSGNSGTFTDGGCFLNMADCTSGHLNLFSCDLNYMSHPRGSSQLPGFFLPRAEL